MKEIGVVIRWGRVVPGREKEAIEFFAEISAYFGEKLGRGEITYFEPYLFMTADSEVERGFFIVKGAPENIYALFDERKSMELMARCYQLVAHVKRDLVVFGGEVLEQVQLFAEANKVLATV